MPTPYDYTTAQPNVGSYFDAMRQGRTDRLAVEQEQRNNALSRYLPGALQGDDGQRQSALDAAAGDPNMVMQLSQSFSGADRVKLEKARETNNQIAALAAWADTPDKWQVALAEARKISPDIGEIGFEQRGAIIAKAQTVSEQLEQAWKAKAHDLDVSRTTAQNAASYASAAASRAQAEGGGEASLPVQTLSFMADQYLAGDRSVLTNLGRGAQGAKNIVALRTMITEKAVAAGLKPAEVASIMGEFEGYKAGQRVLGGRVANMGMAVNEAYQMADLVTGASANVSRSQFLPANLALQAWQKNTGSPEQVRFGAALNSFINAYARAISPVGVPTVSDKEHARDMLETAQSHEQVTAVIDQLKMEMEAAQKAPGMTQKEMRGTFRGESGAHSPASPPSGPKRIKYDSSGRRIP